MTWALSGLILLSALGDLAAIRWGKRSWRYLFKPGTIFLIIGLAATALPEAGPIGYWILVGLLFSVAGDIFLVLPSDQFLPGLISFFVAHLCYIVAFSLGTLRFDLSTLLVALALLGIALLFFMRLRPGVEEQGGGRLLLPVASYVTVISLMVLMAYASSNPWLLAGAVAFFLSDAILAWNRFIQPFRLADLGVMTTYFGAQYLIALSLLLS